jgi:hypothetical protein
MKDIDLCQDEEMPPHKMPANARPAKVRAAKISVRVSKRFPLLKRIELGLHLLGQTRANQFIRYC